MRLMYVIAVAAIAGLGIVWAGAQDRGGSPSTANDEAGLKATMDSYCTTLRSGDLNAIMNFWAADADFTTESGDVVKGREAISKLFAENLAELKTGKSVLKHENLRFLSPDVVAIEGSVEFTPASGPVESNRFSAVWTRRNGKWIIASARDLPETTGQAADRGMKEMQWLAGEWTAKDRDTNIRLTVKPELDSKFAFAKFEVKGPTQSVTIYQMIGFDPLEGSLRSWTFDSRGSYGESAWAREGSTWIGETVGVLSTGQQGTAINAIQMMGPNQFKWSATSREVDGQPLPDSEITYNRVNPR